MDQTAWIIGERIPWLPDETLFSWCARYHLLAGNGLASVTCQQLFGARRRGTAHDFPTGLQALVNRSAGSLGTIDTLVQDRTVLPFYGPFRPSELYERATLSMAGAGIGSLKYQLGLLTSGLGAAHPLKACPACMREDHRSHAVAHWRRVHQWPAVWLCPIHDEPLLVSPVKLDQRARFQFVLPVEAGLVPWWKAPDGRLELNPLRKLAAFAQILSVLPPGRLAHAAAIAHAVTDAMRQRSWMKPSGPIAWRSFEAELLRHTTAMARLPPMAMQLDVHAAYAQLSRIISARSLTHPLRYLVWLSLLFNDFQAFVDAHDQACLTLPHPEDSILIPISPEKTTDQTRKLAQQEAIGQLMAGEESATALAKRYGVTHSTIAAWAAKAGLETPRRPKVVDASKRQTAIERLTSGADKANVATQLGVAEVTITKILRCVPGLQEQWHAVRRLIAKDKARTAWRNITQASQSLGVTAARRAEPAVYAWLYRNDREWLKNHSTGFADMRQEVNHADSRRKRADGRYARALETASHAADLLHPEHWTLLAPGLKRVLKQPEAWPQTVAVLQRLETIRKPVDEANPS